MRNIRKHYDSQDLTHRMLFNNGYLYIMFFNNQ